MESVRNFTCHVILTDSEYVKRVETMANCGYHDKAVLYEQVVRNITSTPIYVTTRNNKTVKIPPELEAKYSSSCQEIIEIYIRDVRLFDSRSRFVLENPALVATGGGYLITIPKRIFNQGPIYIEEVDFLITTEEYLDPYTKQPPEIHPKSFEAKTKLLNEVCHDDLQSDVYHGVELFINDPIGRLDALYFMIGEFCIKANIQKESTNPCRVQLAYLVEDGVTNLETFKFEDIIIAVSGKGAVHQIISDSGIPLTFACNKESLVKLQKNASAFSKVLSCDHKGLEVLIKDACDSLKLIHAEEMTRKKIEYGDDKAELKNTILRQKQDIQDREDKIRVLTIDVEITNKRNDALHADAVRKQELRENDKARQHAADARKHAEDARKQETKSLVMRNISSFFTTTAAVIIAVVKILPLWLASLFKQG